MYTQRSLGKSAAFIDSTHVLPLLQTPTQSTRIYTQCVTHIFPPRRYFFCCDAHVGHSLHSSERRRSICPCSTANKTRKKNQKKICGLWVGEWENFWNECVYHLHISTNTARAYLLPLKTPKWLKLTWEWVTFVLYKLLEIRV